MKKIAIYSWAKIIMNEKQDFEKVIVRDLGSQFGRMISIKENTEGFCRNKVTVNVFRRPPLQKFVF